VRSFFSVFLLFLTSSLRWYVFMNTFSPQPDSHSPIPASSVDAMAGPFFCFYFSFFLSLSPRGAQPAANRFFPLVPFRFYSHFGRSTSRSFRSWSSPPLRKISFCSHFALQNSLPLSISLLDWFKMFLSKTVSPVGNDSWAGPPSSFSVSFALFWSEFPHFTLTSPTEVSTGVVALLVPRPLLFLYPCIARPFFLCRRCLPLHYGPIQSPSGLPAAGRRKSRMLRSIGEGALLPFFAFSPFPSLLFLRPESGASSLKVLAALLENPSSPD